MLGMKTRAVNQVAKPVNDGGGLSTLVELRIGALQEFEASQGQVIWRGEWLVRGQALSLRQNSVVMASSV